MDDDEIIARLRAFGRTPVPAPIERDHLEELAGASATPRLRRGRVLAAAAAVAVLAAAGAAAAAVGGGRDTVEVSPTQQGDGEAPADATEGPGRADPSPTDPCVGPPPFAGVEPESGEARAAEAEEHAAFRAEHCPADTDGAGSRPEGVPGGPPAGVVPERGGPDPFPDDPCRGGPAFAGEVPESGEARQAESDAHEAFREENCPPEDAEIDAADREADDADAGPPAGVPAGPPPGTPTGPPDGTPGGPPGGAPTMDG